jgi:hypothetical protein
MIIAKQIIGVLMVILNLLWIGEWIRLLYYYHFTNVAWFYMYPDWALILNGFIGLIGVYLGYRLIKNKLTILLALSTEIPLLILGMAVLYYVPM